MASAEHFDKDVYDGEVEYDSNDDGYVEEVAVDGSDDGEVEIEEGDEADDEEEGGAGGGANGDQGQMLYIPGIGYLPLSSLGNIPGLNIQGGRPAAPQAAPAPEGEREWASFVDFPHITQQSILDLFGSLEEDGRSELTILMLGKGGVGKSSTVNSLLNERAANALAFQQDNTKPTVFSRRVQDFTLNLIDTPSVLDQDAVSDMRLEAIAKAIKDRPIDAVLFLDRLDSYSIGAIDQAVIAGITKVLGPEIWECAVIGFTRASEGAQPAGVEFEDFVEQRGHAVKAAIAKATGVSASDIPVTLIENSSQCEKNEDGEKIVPAYTPWLQDLLEKVTEVALNEAPFEYDPKKSSKASDPNKKRRWLIPLAIAVQVGLKLVLDRVMDDDGCRGDSNGPFDEKTVKERRAELKQEKERERKRKQKQVAQKQVASSRSAAADVVDDYEEDSFDEEYGSDE